MIRKPIALSFEFNQILNELGESDDSYFITGRAGTGKSTLLSLFRKTSRKKVIVLAPTGVAALNVKGQTIHSFFGFPPKLMQSSSIRKRKNKRIFLQIDTIIIDEISMVRADLIDHIDYFLRLHRENQEPFGGVQMLFFGDLFQLPPVVSTPFEKQYFNTTYRSPFFFDAHVFHQGAAYLQFIELRTVYRQKQKSFLRLLDAIRHQDIEEDDLVDLNSRVSTEVSERQGAITLCSRNAKADQINREELAKINEVEQSFEASIEGVFDPRLYPTDRWLQLKVGAQVMFLKNDPGRKYVNGTIGRIETLDEQNVGISMIDDAGQKKLIELGKAQWEIIKYKLGDLKNPTIESETIGVFSQWPIKLAWAVTIHKSQGKTFDKVIIDMGRGAFAHGQTYVALSRCRTFEGISLTAPISYRDILLDPRIVTYYEDISRR